MSLVDTDEGMPGIARDVANKQITAPVDHQHALLFFALDRNKPHSGPLNRLAACLGLGSICWS